MNFDVINRMLSLTQKIADVAEIKLDMSQHVSVCVGVIKFGDVVTFDIST